MRTTLYTEIIVKQIISFLYFNVFNPEFEQTVFELFNRVLCTYTKYKVNNPYDNRFKIFGDNDDLKIIPNNNY